MGNKTEESIYKDDRLKSINKMRRFQWSTYPLIQKNGIRNKKQKIKFEHDDQNNTQYGLRSMYKYGGQGIFGQITIIE